MGEKVNNEVQCPHCGHFVGAASRCANCGARLERRMGLKVLRISALLVAVFGVFLLSSGVQGWFIGGRAVWFLRVGLIFAALAMIEGGIWTDLIGIGVAIGVYLIQKVFKPAPDATIPVRGAD